MTTDLAGTRHVVVGASSDIGEALTTRLLESGVEVVALDSEPPRAPVSTFLDVDMTTKWSIDDAVMRLGGRYDGLTFVVEARHAAGPEEVLVVNALGVRHLCEEMYELLNPGGCVTIVASIAAIDWSARLATIDDLLATEGIDGGLAWYAMRDGEVDARVFASEVVTVYALAMGLTLAGIGLRINVVLRGPVAPSEVGPIGDAASDTTRVLSPCGIADAVVLLNSPAARWINGHALVVDGGLTGGALAGVIGSPPIPGRSGTVLAACRTKPDDHERFFDA